MTKCPFAWLTIDILSITLTGQVTDIHDKSGDHPIVSGASLLDRAVSEPPDCSSFVPTLRLRGADCSGSRKMVSTRQHLRAFSTNSNLHSRVGTRRTRAFGTVHVYRRTIKKMKTSLFHENEYALFWQISGDLLQAVREHQPQDVIDYHLVELEGIRVNTAQVTLRKRCSSLQAQFRVAEATGSASR
jgi:hypothetical protein